MSNIDYTKLRLSLQRLEEQHDNYLNPDPLLAPLNREAVMESTIHRFEVCIDTLWKTLHRYLTEELGIADVPHGPKPIFRMAHDAGLMRGSVEDWFAYNTARIDTSHDYDAQKAQDCLDLVGAFIEDAVGLYQTMTGETWT